MTERTDTSRWDVVSSLHRDRPRDRFVRTSFAVALAAIGLSFLFGGFDFADAFSARRMENLNRFLGEMRPFPLQGRPFDLGEALSFYREIWVEKGQDAAISTLAISVLAIVLAAGVALPIAIIAARNVTRPDPFLVCARPAGPMERFAWRGASSAARVMLVVCRAIPEYLIAFFLLAMIGPSPWPVVLALAIHNAGILGRLTAETIENAAPFPLQALRGIGASRAQISWLALPALLLTRFLLFLFYRWETCVREATVLGLLGVVSLGYWISDFRARGQYDGFVFLIAVGAAIVMLGDFASGWVRKRVRDAGGRVFCQTVGRS